MTDIQALEENVEEVAADEGTTQEVAETRGAGGPTPWHEPWTVALMVFWALLIWFGALVLPGPSDDRRLSDGWLWTIGLIGVVVLVVGLGLFALDLRHNWERAKLFAFALMIAGGLVLYGVFLLASESTVTPGTRLAVGVGGTAIAALTIGVVGIGGIRGIRDAASIAAAVLVVGVITYPEVSSVVDAETRQQVVKWMAILIGANAAADAVVKGAEVVSKR